jgi:Predicted DNA-binding proteins
MVRPKQTRHIAAAPTVTYFKPQGVPMIYLNEVRLSVEGLEAVRLADLENMSCQEAAGHMRVSRHTFGRILGQARRLIAEALVTGQALRIEGGHWAFTDEPINVCPRGVTQNSGTNAGPESQEEI